MTGQPTPPNLLRNKGLRPYAGKPMVNEPKALFLGEYLAWKGVGWLAINSLCCRYILWYYRLEAHHLWWFVVFFFLTFFSVASTAREAACKFGLDDWTSGWVEDGEIGRRWSWWMMNFQVHNFQCRLFVAPLVMTFFFPPENCQAPRLRHFWRLHNEVGNMWQLALNSLR